MYVPNSWSCDWGFGKDLCFESKGFVGKVGTFESTPHPVSVWKVSQLSSGSPSLFFLLKECHPGGDCLQGGGWILYIYVYVYIYIY